MKIIYVENPRENIKHAYISNYRGNIMLNVERWGLPHIMEMYNTVRSAKIQYAKEYQSPKYFDKPIWKEKEILS